VASAGKVLVHACCAVCLEAIHGALVEEGWRVEVFFYNPNIHPYREFAKRLRAVEVSAESKKLPLTADKEYGLAEYLEKILPAGEGRCRACYELRLGRTAEAAAAGGFDAFTTTLLASPHQKHEAVKAAGEGAAGHGVPFLYRDWRGRMELGVREARRRSLYRQQYCGCILSEYERFGPQSERTGV
jgi:hypothetical protein